jgi:hypothetical protein
MFADDTEVAPLLMGNSKALSSLPVQRRQAIQFRYGDIPRDHSMAAIGAFAPPLQEQKIQSTVHRDCQNTPCDSWEIDVCVGFAVEKMIAPNWAQVKQLGRCLAIFKVHKEPKVCELFFMPREEVIKTYKDVMPKNLEWVHLYDPETEFAFWAELYRPSEKKAGRGTSLLTDELCGGFGSRHCMAKNLRALLEAEPTQKVKDKIRVLTSACSREECQELTAQAQNKMDKNRRKKERQKERKREQKAQDAEEEQRIKLEEEEMEAACSKANRIPAPHLQNFDFASLMAKPM